MESAAAKTNPASPAELFQPTPFVAHPLFRGGFLQTIAPRYLPAVNCPVDQRHQVDLEDGDALVLHQSDPQVSTGDTKDQQETGPNLVLYHGLGGCHRSQYMQRITDGALALGWRVYRVDMRGCGQAIDLASGINHAGRSDDVAAALEFVGQRHPAGQLFAAGVSLGGNQLLRFLGRVGAGQDARPAWFCRLLAAVAVVPPIDLVACSHNMQRLSRRIYNHYFIKALFDSIGTRARQQAAFQQLLSGRRPRTLWELDERLTAPLSGFAGAKEYYESSSSAAVAPQIDLPCLVVSAKDDPIIPAGCFAGVQWSATTTWLGCKSGGHAGFVGPGRVPWIDRCVLQWLQRF